MTDRFGGIHNRIKQARKRRGLTQPTLAKKCTKIGYKVAASSISEYEHGSNPPAQFVAAFCKALDINPSWVLWDEGGMDLPQQDVTTLLWGFLAEVVNGKLEAEELQERLVVATEVIRWRAADEHADLHTLLGPER